MAMQPSQRRRGRTAALRMVAAAILLDGSAARAQAVQTQTLQAQTLQSQAGPQLRGPQDDLQPQSDAVPPFRLEADEATRGRAVDCLAEAVYYEAGDQSPQGKAAVAQVVLNRVRHPAYPKSVCGVVYQGAPYRGCQFTFACDGSLARRPEGEGWLAARATAEHALDGYVEVSVGASTHYHAIWAHPYWSSSMRPTLRVGGHQFYRFPGTVGQVSALSGAYAGAEPVISRAALFQPAPSPTPRSAYRPIRQAQPDCFRVWGLEVATVGPGGRIVRSGASPG
ncbi:MAG: cell wall hydrolase [Caulobacteraceae bacterium]|nr:cell wall hydrolase [Caulobacteraceae bacterium]